MKTFNKFEFFGATTICLIGGIAIGYSKAREIFIEALLTATANSKDNKEKEES